MEFGGDINVVELVANLHASLNTFENSVDDLGHKKLNLVYDIFELILVSFFMCGKYIRKLLQFIDFPLGKLSVTSLNSLNDGPLVESDLFIKDVSGTLHDV